MRKLVLLTALATIIGGTAIAGPLEGVKRQIDRNPAMETFTSGADGQEYAGTEDNGVLLGSQTIGVRNGQGGAHASETSVVSPWVSSGCTSSTRVDLPGGDGSGC